MPSIVFPIDTLSVFFEEKKIPVIVDGEDAIGNVHVNFAEINPTAYFSNYHKWSFRPKKCFFLYLNDSYRDLVKPVINGNFFRRGTLEGVLLNRNKRLLVFYVHKKRN